ncbi:MAG: DUF2937 family protein [Roseovarius gahaiensis]
MILRAIAIAGGLVGAAGLSQFPEYSQQYTQRLSGAVDELSGVVAQFDADAAGLGLNRDEALEALHAGGRMGEARAISMGYVLERHQDLSRDLAALEGSTLAGKIMNAKHLMDLELAHKTWADFKPALPLSQAGLILTGLGFLAGYGVLVGMVSGLARLRRRRKSAQA